MKGSEIVFNYVHLLYYKYRKINPNLGGEEWNSFSVKELSALLGGITSKHHGDFCCLNCLHSFATEKKRESHKKYVKVKIFVIF